MKSEIKSCVIALEIKRITIFAVVNIRARL